MWRGRAFLLALIFCASAEAQEQTYAISAFGTFTTSSKLFYHPNDPDDLRRGQYLPLDNAFSGGIEVRRELPSLRIRVGLSIEIISKKETINLPSASTFIPVNDGFVAVPVELSGYFMIPVGSDHTYMYMGGGIGAYFGNRIYEFPGARAETVGRSPGFGIHVLTGFEYDAEERISLRTEIKFRDVQFESVNQFIQPSITYRGSVIPLNQEPQTSRINIDGMVVSFGLAYHL